MTLQLSLPLEIEIKANMPSKINPVASKDIKTINHTTQHPKTLKNGKSRTRWTDEEWSKEYEKIINKELKYAADPKQLIRKALEWEDKSIAMRVDLILSGYHNDNRKRTRRTEEDLIADGNWYHLCELAKIMRVKG
jgi:hypothetical protein